MRPTPFRRVHLGIATLVVLTLIGTILANTSATPPVSAQSAIEPAFLTWEGEPYSDGQNHFLITVADAPAPGGDGWLRLTDDELVAASTPRPSITPDQIDEAVAVGARQSMSPEQVLTVVGSRDDVTSIRSVAFGIHAVAGTIDGDELAAIPGVSAVSVDPGLNAATVDPYFPTQWGLDNDGVTSDPWAVSVDADIDAPEGWHRTRGAGVIVAVIDSGVDVSHPDLSANIWTNPGEQCGNGADDDGNGYVDDCHGWDFANRVSSVADYVGHGTHVAGIIAAEADNGIGIAGVAHESEIMALKIGDGTPALSAGIEAIAYAIDNGARVINASWGVNDPVAAEFLDAAIAAAEAAGVLFVTAAGNEPVDVDVTPVFPAASPLDNVVTVGASTATDAPASWSGYGATTVDIFAPGEYIISTVPGGYGIYSGTSMATPMVAGAAALLWAATPEATYAEVKGSLLDRSDGPNDGVTAFRDLAVSDGRLNIENSVYAAPLFRPSVMYEFHDFDDIDPDAVHPVSITAKTVDPWMVPPQTPSMYRAGLYVPEDGNPMAVVGMEITHTGAGGDEVVTTDGTGRVLLGTEFHPENRSDLVQGGDWTRLILQLPAGTYALVMEIVDVTDAAAPVTMGDPSAVFFIVGNDGSVNEMPQIPIGGTPAPTTTTTFATTAAPTTAGPTTTTPTTTAPTTSAPTTTVVGPTTTAAPTTTTTTEQPPVATTTTTVVSATTTTQPPPITVAPTTTSPPVATTSPPPSTTTEAPGAGSPTTTTTSTTTTTASPAPAGMRITGVNPSQGPVAGRTLVTITGEGLPESADVLFGAQSAEIVTTVGSTFIVVDTPPGQPGWVNVVVVDRATGDEAVFENGFLYIADGEEPAPTTTTSAPTTTIAVTTTTTAPTTTTPATTAVPASTTAAPIIPNDQFDRWRDSVLQTPEGLTLAPPAADDPINAIALDVWIGALCDEPVCRGWVLED